MTNTSQNYGTTLLRVSFGSILLSHGLLKLFVFTIPGTVGFFESIGLPPIAAYLTIFGEIAGGAAILTGFLTRLASALTIPILLGATHAHSANGWVFSNAGGGWEFPALLVTLAVVVAIQGSGTFAINRLNIVQNYLPKFLTA